jgi:uncharacterized protein (TIGR02145 family)
MATKTLILLIQHFMKQFIALFIFALTFFMGCKKNDKVVLAAVTTTEATGVTTTNLKTGGNITDNGGGYIIHRGIAWALHAIPTVGDSIIQEPVGNGSFTTMMVGLNANTTYYLRAYGSNQAGTAYGNEISVKTPPGLATIVTSAVSNVKPLVATVGGTISNDGGDNITERGIVYGTSPNPTVSGDKKAAGTGTGTFSVVLTPLESLVLYYARAYAINGYGVAYGNQIKFNSAPATTVKDIDGNVYPYVNICGKDWFGANLKVTHYNNGDPIVNGVDGAFNWLTNTQGAYTYPAGKQENNEYYGKLYNIEAIMGTRNVCPSGWHVASELDWEAAEVCMGMDPGTANTSNDRCCGGFKFIEGGSSGLEINRPGQFFTDASTGSSVYVGLGSFGQFWTSTERPGVPGTNRYRMFYVPGAPSNDIIVRQNTDRTTKMAVRCVRD